MTDFLDGVRVIEAAVLLNGDALGMYLGDHGADVIKVEQPPEGDYLRDMHGTLAPRQSVTHLQCNKNKRSLSLNLRTDEGREIFWRCCRPPTSSSTASRATPVRGSASVTKSNAARKPDIIYCQVSGFGAARSVRSDPDARADDERARRAQPAAMGPDGFVEPIDARLTHGVFGVGMGPDVVALHAAYHIAGALLRRERTGCRRLHRHRGRLTPLVVSGWRCLSQYLNDDRITDRRGIIPDDERSDAAKYQLYETADKKIVLFCAIEHKFWRRFCELVERPDLADRGDVSLPVDHAYGDVELRRELQAIFHDEGPCVVGAARRRPSSSRIGPNHASTSDLLADEQLRSPGRVRRGRASTRRALHLHRAGQHREGRVRLLACAVPLQRSASTRDELLAELGYSACAGRRLPGA